MPYPEEAEYEAAEPKNLGTVQISDIYFHENFQLVWTDPKKMLNLNGAKESRRMGVRIYAVYEDDSEVFFSECKRGGANTSSTTIQRGGLLRLLTDELPLKLKYIRLRYFDFNDDGIYDWQGQKGLFTITITPISEKAFEPIVVQE